MKTKDFIWIGIIVVISTLLAVKDTRVVFENITLAHPYLMGFIKTAILATMGEYLALRIVTGDYKGNIGVGYKFIIWGFFGMTFVVVFSIFNGGVNIAQTKHLLPLLNVETLEGKLLLAFLTSMFMNLIFAPTFMALHRVTDAYIELGKGKWNEIRKIELKEVVASIDWYTFINFVVIKTIPLFWIPAHTITFLLPAQYRVLMAAFLSIALGVILSIGKRKKVSQNN